MLPLLQIVILIWSANTLLNKKTGGGPRPKPISQAMEIIIDLYNTVMLKWCTCMIFQYSTEKISNKRKVQLADVYELQCQVYKKELIKRDKEIERLNLQIKL
jgi:sensor histidine kinase YesM